jgi:hypothetical protein
MGYSFNGLTKIISLTSGTTTLDVRDMYSRWKDWIKDSDGNKYLQAMYPVGGDPINEDEGIYVSSYIFLINGWRVRPQEASHTLTVENGILLTDTGDDPFIPTIGTYNVQVKYSQPIRTETVNIAGGSGGLTDEEHDQLMAIPLSGQALTEEEHNQLMNKVLTTAKFLALK